MKTRSIKIFNQNSIGLLSRFDNNYKNKKKKKFENSIFNFYKCNQLITKFLNETRAFLASSNR